MEIQKGDTVIVLKGSDREKIGTVISVVPQDEKVIVRGVNVRTYHRKPKMRDEKGSIEKAEAPIAVSNVAVVDPKENKATRIGYSGIGREKQRITRRSNTILKKTVSGGKVIKEKRGGAAAKKGQVIVEKVEKQSKEKK